MRNRLKTLFVVRIGAESLCISDSAIATGDTHTSASSAAVIDLIQGRAV